jgi:hypothetical protein
MKVYKYYRNIVKDNANLNVTNSLSSALIDFLRMVSYFVRSFSRIVNNSLNDSVDKRR